MTGFFDTDRWNEIWQTISRIRRRSIMTALGVFWGSFMLIVLLGAGTGLGRMFRAQLGNWTGTTWKRSGNYPASNTSRLFAGAINAT